MKVTIGNLQLDHGAAGDVKQPNAAHSKRDEKTQSNAVKRDLAPGLIDADVSRDGDKLVVKADAASPAARTRERWAVHKKAQRL